MKTPTHMLGAASLLICLTPALSTAAEQISQSETGREVEAMENQVFFISGSGDQVPESVRKMRERLRDPEQRVALRAEQRASVQEWNPELDQALGIDGPTQEKLLELLTEHQMRQLDRVHNPPPATPDDVRDSIQQQADFETQRLTELRELLGEDGLGRYQQYSKTLSERIQMRRFDARLDEANKLRPDQKAQLMALYREHMQGELERNRIEHMPWMLQNMQERPTPAEMQRNAQLSTIAANEQIWRRMPQSDREFAERAAKFLTPAQLAVLERMNAAKADELRRWIEQARLAAGLNPTIPEHAEVAEPRLQRPVRTPIVGDLKFQVSVAVNGAQPTVIAHSGANRAPVTFEVAEGLIVEATPTLYDDHWLDVNLKYYEKTADGDKRLLQESSGMGTLTRMPDGAPNRGGGGMSIVTGSKGYAVNVMVTAEPL
jgi:hypothetical protein